MVQKIVDDYRELLPTLLPEIMTNANIDSVQYDDVTTIISYDLAQSFELEDIMDFMEDQMLLTFLYHYVPSEQTTFGHQVCAYSDWHFGNMFKVHITTNGAGKVNRLVVTIFDSMEAMGANLILDLELHERSGRFIQKREKTDVLVEFC